MRCTNPSTGSPPSRSSSIRTRASTSAASGHKRAMAYLEYGLSQSEGFIVITGEIGAGKTTLVRNLLEQLDREQDRRRADRHHAARRRRHAAHGRRRRSACRTKAPTRPTAARALEAIPVPARRRGQARAADRRRSAEPDAARGRGAAHAVELPARRPARCCRASCSASPSSAHMLQSPEHAAAAPARDRHATTSARWTPRRPRLHRASPAHRRLEGRSGVRRRRASPAIHAASRRHPAQDQHAVRPAAAVGYLEEMHAFGALDSDRARGDREEFEVPQTLEPAPKPRQVSHAAARRRGTKTSSRRRKACAAAPAASRCDERMMRLEKIVRVRAVDPEEDRRRAPDPHPPG